jgi:hypothetical protein
VAVGNGSSQLNNTRELNEDWLNKILAEPFCAEERGVSMHDGHRVICYSCATCLVSFAVLLVPANYITQPESRLIFHRVVHQITREMYMCVCVINAVYSIHNPFTGTSLQMVSLFPVHSIPYISM